MKTIKRQTRAAYGCMATDQSPSAWTWAASQVVRRLCAAQRRCNCCVRLMVYMQGGPKK